MRSTPTAKDNLEAAQLQCLDRHHLLKVMLDVVEKVVFVLKMLILYAETLLVSSVGG